MKLTLDGVALQQGAFHARFDLEVSAASVALVGPSGSGKTTLLETVAGLRPCSGRITLDDRVLQNSSRRFWMPPRERRIGYVPQDLALFPHLDVQGNLGFGLRPGPGPALEEVAHALELSDRLGARVQELSGGERRRVALGRALLSRPALLILDEPGTHLEPLLRKRVAALMRRLGETFQVPFIWVSHDWTEFRGLCSQVAFLNGGRCSSVSSTRQSSATAEAMWRRKSQAGIRVSPQRAWFSEPRDTPVRKRPEVISWIRPFRLIRQLFKDLPYLRHIRRRIAP